MPGSGPDINFSLKVEGTDKLERVLRKASERLSPVGMQKLNEGIVEGLQKYYEKNWPMRVPRRLPQTDVRWPEGSTLDLTGALKESLARTSQNSVRVVTPNEIRFGTKLFYARFINDGTKKMAPRPFLVLTPKLRVAILETVKQYVGFAPDLRLTSGFRGL